jgi:hypothetical protein
MLLLTSTSDIIRLVTGTATSTIEVHASYVDANGSTITPGRTNTRITTATTTTIVASPGASTQRNVKAIYVTNNSAGTNCNVGLEHFDGTNSVELMQFVLLPGENMGYREDGSWVHRDQNGAEYPPSGLGNYGGRSIPFMKTSTATDVAGCWYCTSKDAGYPGAWAPGTPGINGRVTDGTASGDYGCIPIPNPSTGGNYLTALEMAASVVHTNDFFDVLWVNTGIVLATLTEQAITTPTLPARDVNGTTNGEGCGIALLVTSAALNNAAANAGITVRYTNSKGTGSKVATLSAIAGSQLPATAVVGTIIWFQLAAGDTGVQSIQGITNTTSLGTTGSVSLMICRDISTIGTAVVNVSTPKVIGSPGIRLYNGTCMLHNILSSATTATFFSGSLAVMEK